MRLRYPDPVPPPIPRAIRIILWLDLAGAVGTVTWSGHDMPWFARLMMVGISLLLAVILTLDSACSAWLPRTSA